MDRLSEILGGKQPKWWVDYDESTVILGILARRHFFFLCEYHQFFASSSSLFFTKKPYKYHLGLTIVLENTCNLWVRLDIEVDRE